MHPALLLVSAIDPAASRQLVDAAVARDLEALGRLLRPEHPLFGQGAEARRLWVNFCLNASPDDIREAVRRAPAGHGLSPAPVLLCRVDDPWALAEAILDEGLPVDAPSEGEVTLLMWAARQGREDAVARLLARGAGANRASSAGKTPLMEACEKGHTRIVEQLLRHGAAADAQTRKGWSPLMWAAEKGFEPVVARLLEAGAALGLKNDRGHTARQIALAHGHVGTARLIRRAWWRRNAPWMGGIWAATAVAAWIAHWRRAKSRSPR